MRYFLDFGVINGNQTPPTFAWFRDAATGAAIAAPLIVADPAPAWTYHFDFTFPPGTSPSTTSIGYGVALNGTGLTDVISNAPVQPTQAQPLSTVGAGGALTLTQIIARIRQQSDTENDPHISDAEITDWFNESRFELYGKLVTSFGDDYYVSKAQFTTDGVNTAYALPDGVLYGGALPYFKGELLEAIGGVGTASPVTPISLTKFNLREKNRFSHPFVVVASRGFLPRYRPVGSNIELWPLPNAGIQLQLWYAPRLSILVNPSDVADDMNGWLSLPIVDCVIKCIAKQERDPSIHIGRKLGIETRLDAEIKDRDLGEPNTVTMTEGDGSGPFGAGSGLGGAWS